MCRGGEGGGGSGARGDDCLVPKTGAEVGGGWVWKRGDQYEPASASAGRRRACRSLKTSPLVADGLVAAARGNPKPLMAETESTRHTER